MKKIYVKIDETFWKVQRWLFIWENALDKIGILVKLQRTADCKNELYILDKNLTDFSYRCTIN